MSMPAILRLVVWALGLGFASACAQTVSQGHHTEVRPVEIVQLADGVWMHTGYEIVKPWGNIPTNGLIVERDDYSVLVDTAWNDDQTLEILDWARDTLGKPVRASVHTHAHGDKMGGMPALHSRDVRTYATTLTNALALERGLQQASLVLDLPVIGDRTEWEGLTILYPGGGHSEDNIVVFHAASQTLFGGCMLRPLKSFSLGNTGDANLVTWEQAVRNTKAAFPDADKIVQSHAPVYGPEVLDSTIALLADKAG